MSGINEISEVLDRLIAERYVDMTPQERVLLCSRMFDIASLIVHTTLPPNLSRRDHRLAWLRRFYEGELPEKTLIAVAEWQPPA